MTTTASKTGHTFSGSGEDESMEESSDSECEEEERSEESDVVAVKSVPLMASLEPAFNCLFCFSPVLKYNCEQAKVERKLIIRTSERLLHYVCNYLEFDEKVEELLTSRRNKKEGQTRLLPGNLPLCLKCRMLYYHKIYEAFVQYELAIDSLNEKITACITKEIATSAKNYSKSVEVEGGWSDQGGFSKENEMMMMVKQFRKKVVERNPTAYCNEENKEKVKNILSSSFPNTGANSNSSATGPMVKNVIHVVKTNMADEMIKTVEDKQKESLERIQGVKQDMVKEVFDGVSGAESSSSKNQPFQYYAVANPSPGVIQIIPMKNPGETKGKSKRRREPKYKERQIQNNTCKFCLKLLPDPLSLIRHKVNEHGMQKPEKCTFRECEFRCIEKNYLVRHMQTHLDASERINPFQCDECGKGFKSKSSLRNHMDGHAGNRRMWTCDICGKKFKVRESKQMCENKHKDIKKFECSHPNCGKKFLRKEVLKIHERTHTGEKPYKCECCGKRFSQRSPLITHLKNVHNK